MVILKVVVRGVGVGGVVVDVVAVVGKIERIVGSVESAVAFLMVMMDCAGWIVGLRFVVAVVAAVAGMRAAVSLAGTAGFDSRRTPDSAYNSVERAAVAILVAEAVCLEEDSDLIQIGRGGRWQWDAGRV
jgi:hypothetical protein